MTENRTIEIPLSKAKLAKLLLFSIIALCAGLWIVITDPQVSNPIFGNPVAKAIGGYGGIIMGVLGIYFFTVKLFDSNPGLIISPEGIHENSGMINFGFIPWEDVFHVYERTVQAGLASKQYFITIGLIDPEKYIERQNSSIKRRLMRANMKHYGSPLHISTNGLKIKHPKLLQLLNHEFERYKLASIAAE